MTMFELSPALIVAADIPMQCRLAQVVRQIDGEAEIAIAGTLAEVDILQARIDFAIALVDIELPDGNGCALVSRLRDRHGQIPMLALSSLGHEAAALSALRAGATGYMLKDREDIELVMSLKSIQRGGTPIDPHIARCLLPLLAAIRTLQHAPPHEEIRLSEREAEVLRLVSRGCSNKDVAELTALSRLTIEGYIKNVYRKLAVGSRTAAVFEAQRLGLL